jgi:hypothetical protein
MELIKREKVQVGNEVSVLKSFSQIKSKRISSHSNINIGKYNKILEIFEENNNTKNLIAKKFNDNPYYQDLLFKDKSIKLKSISKEFKYPNLLAWEIQKFVNDDLLEKEKERLERKIKNFKCNLREKTNYKDLLKKREESSSKKNANTFNKTKRISNNLTKVIEKLILLEYF